MPTYCGIGGVVRKLKEWPISIDGTIRKQKEHWAGIDGVNRKIFSSAQSLNESSWEYIREVSDNGTASSIWAVGDMKSVAINGTVGTKTINAVYYVYILGFDHNSSVEGNGITFGCFKTALNDGIDICLIDDKYNNYSNTGEKWFNLNHSSLTSSGGWKGCDLRYDVLGSTKTKGADAISSTATSPVSGTLMAALPSDLRAVMKPMNIYTDNTGGGIDSTPSYVTKSVDYLPLLAEFEIFGTRRYANTTEQNYQEQYQYYKNGNSKVKYQNSVTSSASYWWERSPSKNSIVSFCLVNAAGIASDHFAWYSFGLSPIFRV